MCDDMEVAGDFIEDLAAYMSIDELAATVDEKHVRLGMIVVPGPQAQEESVELLGRLQEVAAEIR